MNGNFKPFLACDGTDHLDSIRMPKYASTKLDGIRAILHPELGLVSRSLKQIQNKQLQEKFKPLLESCESSEVILDGEFYDHDMTFQKITALVMTQDFLEPKTIKKLEKDNSPLLKFYNEDRTEFDNPIKYHCFEMLDVGDITIPFKEKVRKMVDFTSKGEVFSQNVVIVEQTLVHSAEEVKKLFSEKLEQGYEGLILRCPDSTYKYGRSTIREEIMLKVKPFNDYDAKITGVVQATEVDPTAEKTINELNRSVTSKKKDDRILIEKASGFWVDYDGVEQKVSLAMTDPEKEEVWKNKESYIGRWITFKGMEIGKKDKIRHPVFTRFRGDLDD